MKPIYDYYYRFQDKQLQLPGRCRVRIYKRKNGAQVVLLTELATNTGESITGSCERIATDLASRKRLNPKTTRWIQHELMDAEPANDSPGDGPPVGDLPQGDPPQVFDELRFTWGAGNRASNPEWQSMNEEEIVALLGESLAILARQMGEAEP